MRLTLLSHAALSIGLSLAAPAIGDSDTYIYASFTANSDEYCSADQLGSWTFTDHAQCTGPTSCKNLDKQLGVQNVGSIHLETLFTSECAFYVYDEEDCYGTSTVMTQKDCGSYDAPAKVKSIRCKCGEGR